MPFCFHIQARFGESSQIETKAIGRHWVYKMPGRQSMCQSCVEIDKRIERHRELLRLTTDPAEIERIKRLIAELYVDRVRLHQSSER
jgi:K+/H+ antiporter YhaU regulatory subunit KhtT